MRPARSTEAARDAAEAVQRSARLFALVVGVECDGQRLAGDGADEERLLGRVVVPVLATISLLLLIAALGAVP